MSEYHGAECDPHLLLGRSESARSKPLRCVECGGPAEGDASCEDGEICRVCVDKDEAAAAHGASVASLRAPDPNPQGVPR